MSNAIAAAAPDMEPSSRRLAGGLMVSLLLHAVVLSLHFGIPGLRPGTASPLTVRLALPPALTPMPAEPPQVSVPAPDPATAVNMPPAPALPAALPALAARQGFTLFDPPKPQPVPAPAPPALPSRRQPRRRARGHARTAHDGLRTAVIAQDAHKEEVFSVPVADSERAPDPDPVAQAGAPAAADVPPDTPAATAADAQPDEQVREAERVRLAQQRESARDQERQARRDAEEQALRTDAAADAERTAEQQARALARQDARYEEDLALRQRQADEEKRLAEEAQRASEAREQAAAAVRQQLAEQQRIQAEQARAQQLAEQQRIQAKQARAQQLAEQQRIQAEQQRTRQVAEEREADERQRQLQARQQAEQLAREQAARLAEQEQARRQRDDDAGGLMRAGPVAGSAGAGAGGVGRGEGVLPGGSQGGALVSRARELLRGIDIDKPVPPAIRPAEQARRDARRALVDAVLRDVPLRMYVDSVRQKIERNAVIGQALLIEDIVRIFPVVSISIRSDGSVEDVTIVRSSGRPDVDEIVRRVVRLNARYSAFPPNVAANYDVVELRRIWSFSGVLRLLEEMR
jgi:TonB family protein